MNNVTRSIFRAIHEGKWLSIEYKNQQTQQTKYWVAVKGLNPRTRTLTVDGLHLKLLTVQDLTIHIDRIQAAEVVDGSWCPVNETLVADIRDNPGKYTALFANSANLRVLDYLAACNRLDATPYQTNYSLIHAIDADRFDEGAEDAIELGDDQFRELVQRFQRRVDDRRQNAARPSLPQLGLNLISINTNKGLYVLAYRPLRLDVRRRTLRLDVRRRTLRADADPVIFRMNTDRLARAVRAADGACCYFISHKARIPPILSTGKSGATAPFFHPSLCRTRRWVCRVFADFEKDLYKRKKVCYTKYSFWPTDTDNFLWYWQSFCVMIAVNSPEEVRYGARRFYPGQTGDQISHSVCCCPAHRAGPVRGHAGADDVRRRHRLF